METSNEPSQILSYLFLGGRATAKSKSLLLHHNIKYILNCTPNRTADPETGCPNFFEKDSTFKYQRIPIFDNRAEEILNYMELAYLFIEEGRHYGNVLVHCHKGISRSASFVMGYLMKKNDFTWEEALSFLQMSRPIVQPNESFLHQLKQYHPNRGMAQEGHSQRLDEVVAGPQRSARASSGEPTAKRPRVEETLVAPSTQKQQPAANHHDEHDEHDDDGSSSGGNDNVITVNNSGGDGDEEQLLPSTSPTPLETLPTGASESSIMVSNRLMPDEEGEEGEQQAKQSVKGEIR
eukprot:gene2991-3261_t